MVIVAAVDRSEHAKKVAREAGYLATAFGDSLVLIHVMSRSEFIEIESTNVEQSGEAVDIEEIREKASKHADDAAADLSMDYETVGGFGEIATVVNEYASEHDARYIVVGGRKRSPTGKAIFGSTTQDVLLNAEFPVLTVF